MAKSKQLEFHPDKTGFIILGNKQKVEEIRKEISDNPIYCGDFITKEKTQERWLGDISHSGGLAQSVLSTIQERSGKVKGAIFETAALIQDYRLQSAGGLMSGIYIWQLAIVQSLLSNSEMWTEISTEATKTLEGLHKLFLQVLLQVPSSTPGPSFYWETGMLELRYEVMKRKLNFINNLKHMDDNKLAKKIFNEQKKNKWPGLIQECDDICDEIGLPRISASDINKCEINEALKQHNKQKQVTEMKEMSKLKENCEGEFERSPYLDNKNVVEARAMFRVKSGTFPSKMNRRSDPTFSRELWLCEECGQVDTMSHVAVCAAYQPLREGKDINNDKHLAEYMAAVMKVRSKFGKK